MCRSDTWHDDIASDQYGPPDVVGMSRDDMVSSVVCLAQYEGPDVWAVGGCVRSVMIWSGSYYG
jgi:hypothetical protein